MMTFRQEVRGADVEEEAGEEGQQGTQRARLKGKEEGSDDANHRGNSIHHKPSEGLFLVAIISKNHIDGIYTVGKIMS